VGSKNSSNSVRLTEISANVGVPAYLLDDVSELRDEWFEQVGAGASDATVLITAGASAPEDLVAGLCRTLIGRYGGTIEQRDVFNEDVEFGLPATLKRLMREQGVDPEGRRIRVGVYDITEEMYGAAPSDGGASVPLTAEGRKVG
jgi:4-hydroxy-3-methylbut-2-enyl diphosphate reductase